MNILAIDSIGNKTSVASKIGDDLLSISVNHKRKDRPDWQSLLKTINVTSKDLSAFDLFVFGHNWSPSSPIYIQLGGFVPTSLPELFKPSRTSKNLRKSKLFRTEILRKNRKI